MLDFVILFHQTIGIPMGTKCAPLLVDLCGRLPSMASLRIKIEN